MKKLLIAVMLLTTIGMQAQESLFDTFARILIRDTNGIELRRNESEYSCAIAIDKTTIIVVGYMPKNNIYILTVGK